MLYWLTGRRDEHRAVLQARAERAADPSKTLRALWHVDRDPYPVDGITVSLAKARQSAPDDELVWLASADLAIRTGRFDEAGTWLDRYERARPDDPAVWKARLEWAKAVGRPDEVGRAAAHLPASDIPRARILATRAWLAARDGDREAEQSALETIVTLEPANDAALERLAELAAMVGEPGKVAELRRRKAAIDSARDQYNRLINLPDAAPHSAEFARTAEAIGRWFEAKIWWALAARRDVSVADEAKAAIARLAVTDEAECSTRRRDSRRASGTEPDRRGMRPFRAPHDLGHPHVR